MQDTGALVERVVAKALLDAPEDAVQLLLEAERHGDLRSLPYLLGASHILPELPSSCTITERVLWNPCTPWHKAGDLV